MTKASPESAKRPLRMTRQRRAILEALRGVRSHPTADQVYAMLRRRLPRISLGTVYRNLEVLSEAGLIRDLPLGGGARRFDGTTERHYHVRCLRCGRVEDAGLRPLADIERAAGRASRYRIVGHRLEFVGFCPRCGRSARSAHQHAPRRGQNGR